MRIWSIHPKYLDSKGLIALWRETLLVKQVFEGKTKGYKNHPQLNRFRIGNKPTSLINQYLSVVYIEATKRDYNFNKEKIDEVFIKSSIPVTEGQIKYEMEHLLGKLKIRDKERYKRLKDLNVIETHPLFTTIEGEIEEWEKVK